MAERKFVNLKNARKGEYKKVIKEIKKTGECPFCKDNFKYPDKAKGKKEIHLFAYHKKPILKQRNGWLLTEVSWPYKNISYHLMILGKKHRENISELKNKDLKAILYLAKFAIKKYKIKGGALAVRFGDTDYTGASVAHLHFHIVSPEINKKTGRTKTVNFPIG